VKHYLDEETDALRRAARAFIDEHVVPAEDLVIDECLVGERTRLEALRSLARASGLWGTQLSAAYGGRGLNAVATCAVLRETGRSPIGPAVLHCAAPDDANMDLLARAGSDAQKARYLGPLAAGEISSAYCVTEPSPGAGADTGALETRAMRDGSNWVLSGTKTYAVGARDADLLIVLARTGEEAADGATLFLVDAGAHGVQVLREVPTMDARALTRPADVRFDDVRVSEGNVLGAPGRGYALAQVRQIPAQLGTSMRWLGLAARALDMCRAHVTHRESFGRVLSKHQAVQRMLADGVEGIRSAELLTLHAARLLDAGEASATRAHASLAKRAATRATCDVLDAAIQIHGGAGYSDDLPFAAWYRAARGARIHNGPDEVHTMQIAREYLRGRIELGG
jgi:acyl-CoA dehydrogenase